MAIKRFISGLMGSTPDGDTWEADLLDAGTALLLDRGYQNEEREVVLLWLAKNIKACEHQAKSPQALVQTIAELVASELRPQLERGESVLLGFSVWEGTIHKLRALVGHIRSELTGFNQQCLYIAGGPSLNAKSANVAEFLLQPDFFDGLVYGGAADLLGPLKNEGFAANQKKDMQDALRALPSFFDTGKNWDEVEPGNHLSHPPYFSGGELHATLIPQCPHQCKFCLQGQATFVKGQNSGEQIRAINDATRELRDPIFLDLTDPNPMMYPHFPSLLRRLNFNNISGVKMFADMYRFAGFGSGRDDPVAYYMNFLREFRVEGLVFGNEAIQAANDGEWLGKAYGEEVLNEGHYRRINEGSKALLQAAAKDENLQTTLKFNFIFHPGMPIALWLKKLAFMKSLLECGYKHIQMNLALLAIYPGSKLEALHQGHFVYSHALYDLETESNGLYYSPSQWSIDYENAIIMDVASVFNRLVPYHLEMQLTLQQVVLSFLESRGSFADLGKADDKMSRIREIFEIIPEILNISLKQDVDFRAHLPDVASVDQVLAHHLKTIEKREKILASP